MKNDPELSHSCFLLLLAFLGGAIALWLLA